MIFGKESVCTLAFENHQSLVLSQKRNYLSIHICTHLYLYISKYKKNTTLFHLIICLIMQPSFSIKTKLNRDHARKHRSTFVIYIPTHPEFTFKQKQQQKIHELKMAIVLAFRTKAAHKNDFRFFFWFYHR